MITNLKCASFSFLGEQHFDAAPNTGFSLYTNDAFEWRSETIPT